MFALLVFAIGCDDANNTSFQTLTENDFAKDSNLTAHPVNNLVIKFLEHPNSDKPENDTGEIGNDTIPLTYTQTTEHTFCWEDDNNGSAHFMELDDLEGNQILKIDVNGECVTEVIESGEYVMTIHHDAIIDTAHPIFIIPINNNQIVKSIGNFNRYGLFNNLVNKIKHLISNDAIAQTSQNIETLISTRECIGCDLSGADLSSQNLEKVNLTGAILKGADLTNTILTDAVLSNATWLDGECVCSSNSIGECVGCQAADSDKIEITLVNNCNETIWVGTQNLAGDPNWELNKSGCNSDSDCKNNNDNGTCNTNTGNCEQIIEVSKDCNSCKIWPSTGCNFESAFKCATTPDGGEIFCCATGGVHAPEPPVTVAEFTFDSRANMNDFYDVSTIDGYNVAVDMFPIAEIGFSQPAPNFPKEYWCQNPGGPIFGSTNPNTDCTMNGDCEVKDDLANCTWENYFGTDCGGFEGLRAVKPMIISAENNIECPEGSDLMDLPFGKVCTCTDDNQCMNDQICGIGNPQSVKFKMCGEPAGCTNPKSLCGVGQYFDCGGLDANKGDCKSGGEECNVNTECASGNCTDNVCKESPADFLDCRKMFPRTVSCDKDEDCPSLNGLKFPPGVDNNCPEGTKAVRLNKEGIIGCQMKCEQNDVSGTKMCRSMSCEKDIDCLKIKDVNDEEGKKYIDTGIFMLCDTEEGSVTKNQCVATNASMLGSVGVNGQSCVNPTNFEGCTTDADCLVGKCNSNNFCEENGKQVGRFNAASTLCSGCAALETDIWVIAPTEECTKKGNAIGDTTGDCDDKACTNQDWTDSLVPFLSPFKKACPTSYVFPFDDVTATFQCRKPQRANLKYQITFCPQQPN